MKLLAAGYLLAFASGATALIYEVLWMRRFVSLFGATAPAASATLSAIFIGLGAGSAILGSRSARFARPLRAYAILEIGIGAGAALVYPLVELYELLFPSLYAGFSGQQAVFVAVKTVLAIVALFLPAFLMGGTIALLAQAFVSSPHELGITGSGLYAANTFGATLGTLSVPFFLLPWLGVQWSYFCTVCASLLIGLAAYRVDARLAGTRHSASPAGRAKTRIVESDRSLLSRPALAALAFFSGFLTLGLEILWTRMLAQIHENSIYSFAIVLAVFLVALAGGAFLARLLMTTPQSREGTLRGRLQGWDLRKALGLSWLGSGILAFASPGLFYFLTDGLSYVSEFGNYPALMTLLFAAVIMFLPALLAGMSLPLLLQFASRLQRQPQAGPVFGRLLAYNTAGAGIGPLVVTYLFLPGPGLWLSIAAAGLVMAVIGELVLHPLQTRPSHFVRRGAVATFLAVLVIIANPASLPRVNTKREAGEKLIHLNEGPRGIVAVMENGRARSMLLDNFYTLGGTQSAMEERQQAQIPLFLHPDPRRVAFVGLGTGITAGGALLPGVEKLVAVELVPEITLTAEKYFAEENLGVISDRRVELVHEDARIYLKVSGERFDVIVGDLVVPWRSGESSLLTREHFQTARAALAPGGLFCQWLPMYQLTEEQFRITAATFLDVFPQTTVWRGDLLPKVPALALIGHASGAAIDGAAVDRRVQHLKPWSSPRSPLLSSLGGIWLFLIGPIRATDEEFAQARRNRESRPWIELLSPLAHLKPGNQVASSLTGEVLYRFTEKTRRASLAGSVLANLTADHLRWRDAGAILWHASLLLHQGHEDRANTRAAEALALVPPELRAVINGE